MGSFDGCILAYSVEMVVWIASVRLADVFIGQQVCDGVMCG